MIDLLPLIGAAITIGLGLLGFMLPDVAASMVGIEAKSGWPDPRFGQPMAGFSLALVFPAFGSNHMKCSSPSELHGVWQQWPGLWQFSLSMRLHPKI